MATRLRMHPHLEPISSHYTSGWMNNVDMTNRPFRIKRPLHNERPAVRATAQLRPVASSRELQIE
jgi:hypothetical protein